MKNEDDQVDQLKGVSAVEIFLGLARKSISLLTNHVAKIPYYTNSGDIRTAKGQSGLHILAQLRCQL